MKILLSTQLSKDLLKENGDTTRMTKDVKFFNFFVC